MRSSERGFAFFILIILIAAIGVGAFFYFGRSNAGQDSSQETSDVTWSFDMDLGEWVSKGKAPSCSESLKFPSPVDTSLASGILYPGQIRGGDYKPHGGFRFDNLKNNDVDVYAPMDGKLYQAARHLESGEVQYSLYFINDCGIMYKLDHLRELTSKFEEVVGKIPMGAEGDSRTTFINPSVFVAQGEHVGTKIGFEKTRNVFFDFGVYDLRDKNGVDYAEGDYYNIEQYGEYAICWLDNLEEPDKSIVKSLPGVDSVSGKTSDYCK